LSQVGQRLIREGAPSQQIQAQTLRPGVVGSKQVRVAVAQIKVVEVGGARQNIAERIIRIVA
jgi:hypothetical protein